MKALHRTVRFVDRLKDCAPLAESKLLKPAPTSSHESQNGLIRSANAAACFLVSRGSILIVFISTLSRRKCWTISAVGHDGSRMDRLCRPDRRRWSRFGRFGDLLVNLNTLCRGRARFSFPSHGTSQGTSSLAPTKCGEVNEFDFRDNNGICHDRVGVTVRHWRRSHNKDGASADRLNWNGLSFVWPISGCRFPVLSWEEN